MLKKSRQKDEVMRRISFSGQVLAIVVFLPSTIRQNTGCADKKKLCRIDWKTFMGLVVVSAGSSQHENKEMVGKNREGQEPS